MKQKILSLALAFPYSEFTRGKKIAQFGVLNTDIEPCLLRIELRSIVSKNKQTNKQKVLECINSITDWNKRKFFLTGSYPLKVLGELEDEILSRRRNTACPKSEEGISKI